MNIAINSFITAHNLCRSFYKEPPSLKFGYLIKIISFIAITVLSLGTIPATALAHSLVDRIVGWVEPRIVDVANPRIAGGWVEPPTAPKLFKNHPNTPIPDALKEPIKAMNLEALWKNVNPRLRESLTNCKGNLQHSDFSDIEEGPFTYAKTVALFEQVLLALQESNDTESFLRKLIQERGVGWFVHATDREKEGMSPLQLFRHLQESLLILKRASETLPLDKIQEIICGESNPCAPAKIQALQDALAKNNDPLLILAVNFDKYDTRAARIGKLITAYRAHICKKALPKNPTSNQVEQELVKVDLSSGARSADDLTTKVLQFAEKEGLIGPKSPLYQGDKRIETQQEIEQELLNQVKFLDLF